MQLGPQERSLSTTSRFYKYPSALHHARHPKKNMERAIALHSQVCKTAWFLLDDELASFTCLSPPQIQREVSAMGERFRTDIDRMLRQAATVERRSEIKRLRGATSDLSFIRNAAALIHVKLPNELLQDVFSHIHPGVRRDIRATHVCRVWRSFIISLPSFWSDFLGAPKMYIIRKGDPQAASMFSTFLARSAPRMHGLSLHGPNLAMISSSHLTRLSSLCLVFKAKNLPGVHDFLSLRMPYLESLTIRFLCQTEEPPRRALRGPVVPYNGNFPRLRHLSTSGIFLPVYLAAPSIKHLELAECSEDCDLHLPGELHMLSIDALVKFVASCPDLETFHLTNCTPEDAFDADFSTPRLHLPHLRAFTVDDDDREWGVKLLYAFTFPPTTHLQFLCNSAVLEDIIPVSRYGELLSSIDSVVVRLGLDKHNQPSCTLKGFASGAERLSLVVRDFEFDSEVRQKLLRDLVGLFPNATNIHSLDLTFQDGRDDAGQDAWKSILCAFSALHSIALRGASCKGLLLALSLEDMCPQLEHLELGPETWDPEELLQLVSTVERRARGGYRLERITLIRLGSGNREVREGGGVVFTPSDDCVNRLLAYVQCVDV